MNLFETQVTQIAALGVWQIVTGGRMKKPMEQVTDPRWESKTGLFITLKKGDAIRGSMGLLDSTSTLPETLFEVAGAAATHDSRYAPVESTELGELDIEITLLSEMKKLKSPDDIKIGEAGIIVSRGDKRAVLLPQVAVDHKWTAEQFLEACCEKAQLSHKAWCDPNTLVEYFTSRNFSGGKLLQSIQDFVS